MVPLKYSLLLLLLPLFSSATQIPIICVDSSLNLVINTDCSDLRLYKLNQPLCPSDYDSLTIDPSTQIANLRFFGYESIKGIPIFAKNLEEFPKIQKIVLDICPTFLIKKSFFGNSDDPYGFNNVYFSLFNSTGMSGNTGIYQDFFQKSPLVHQYEFEAPLNFSMKNINEKFGIFNDEAEYTVFSMKLYSQYCGQIPASIAPAEIELTKEHPYTHTLSLLILKYFYFNFSLPNNQTTSEYHELFEVCLKNDKDNKTHHFLIDRVAKGKGIIEFWNSLIRVNFIGEGDGCALDSKQWTDSKDGSCDGGLTPCLVSRAQKTNLQYKFDKILRISERFLLKFKLFNAWHNCQHFATDVWDMVHGEKLDFENWEIMEAHSFFSGIEPKLDWIDLEEN